MLDDSFSGASARHRRVFGDKRRFVLEGEVRQKVAVARLADEEVHAEPPEPRGTGGIAQRILGSYEIEFFTHTGRSNACSRRYMVCVGVPLQWMARCLGCYRIFDKHCLLGARFGLTSLASRCVLQHSDAF